MADIRLNGFLTPPVSTAYTTGSSQAKAAAADGRSFSELLQSQLSEPDGIKFSKHAQARLESRSISLDQSDLTKLSGAVDQAASKGVTDSLVLMNNLAFIVSVPQRTVVTAMPVDEAGKNVFTNIDGAVIA